MSSVLIDVEAARWLLCHLTGNGAEPTSESSRDRDPTVCVLVCVQFFFTSSTEYTAFRPQYHLSAQEAGDKISTVCQRRSQHDQR